MNLLKREIDENNTDMFGALKSLVKNLTSKEVSILQIIHDNIGLIALSDNDRSWIEQLSCASLINENDDYFRRANSQLNFNFIYLQSYIIRTYFLFCRINYRHIIQTYLCHVKRSQSMIDGEVLNLGGNYGNMLSPEQLETDWNDLKEMYLDKLYHGHNLLRQIAILLKNDQTDFSNRNLYQFVESQGHDSTLYEQIKHYEIKDFQLCYIDHIRQLYANSISGFQHLFTDVSQLLRVPIEHEIDDELNRMLAAAFISIDYAGNINELMSTIQNITDLLNDLRSSERHLFGQLTCSLKETCTILGIENSILVFIPDEVKCENYVAVSIHLIRTRTMLQERVVNIEEKQTVQWDENFNDKSNEQEARKENHFRDLLQEPVASETKTFGDDEDIWGDILDRQIPTEPPVNGIFPLQNPNPTPEDIVDDESIDYSSLFELYIKFVPVESSVLFEQIHQQYEQPLAEAMPLNKAQKIIVTLPDGKPRTSLWRIENLFEKLRELFNKEKFAFDALVVIDKNEILLDFTDKNSRLPKQISSEYFIIEKTSLFIIQFHYQENIFEYSTTDKCNISTLINRFISDNNIGTSSNNHYLCFFDQNGTSIENRTIANLVQKLGSIENRRISITVTEENNQTSRLCEVTFRPKQSNYLSFDL